MAKKTAKKKTSVPKRTVTGAQVKKGAATLKAVVKAQKNLDLAVHRHTKHLVASFQHGI